MLLRAFRLAAELAIFVAKAAAALEFRPPGSKNHVCGSMGPAATAPPRNGALFVISLNEEDVIMLNYDLSPFYRSTVGFDRLLSMLDKVAGGEQSAPTYPPYNIERTSENAYRITLAVAGFGEHELTVETRDNTLTVRGSKETGVKDEPSAKSFTRASRRALSSAGSSLPTMSW